VDKRPGFKHVAPQIETHRSDDQPEDGRHTEGRKMFVRGMKPVEWITPTQHTAWLSDHLPVYGEAAGGVRRFFTSIRPQMTRRSRFLSL
jgi:hypothetical protein